MAVTVVKPKSLKAVEVHDALDMDDDECSSTDETGDLYVKKVVDLNFNAIACSRAALKLEVAKSSGRASLHRPVVRCQGLPRVAALALMSPLCRPALHRQGLPQVAALAFLMP
jgi:hypothetical protein